MRRNRHRRLPEKSGQTLFRRSRLRQLVVEALEDRRVLSTNPFPELPGMQLVDPHPGQFDGQIVYLDFDGAVNVTYDGPVIVEGIDVPAFRAADELLGQEAGIARDVADYLNSWFSGSGVTFTLDRPDAAGPFSTENQSEALDCAIVALCHLRLGSRDEAQAWYQQATDKARGQEEQGGIVHGLLEEVQSELKLPVQSESTPLGQD